MSAPGPSRIAAPADTRADWETPPALFAALNAEFRFTTDLAADEHNHLTPVWVGSGSRLTDFFALDRAHTNWGEPICYCNPPYGRGLYDWVVGFNALSLRGAAVVALLPNATDTAWYQLAFDTAWEERRLRKRIQFLSPVTHLPVQGNPSGSTVFVWRAGARPYATPAVSYWDFKP